MADNSSEVGQEELEAIGELVEPVIRTQATINWIVRYAKLIEKKQDTTKPCPRNRSSVFKVPPRNELNWCLEVVASTKPNGTGFIGLYLRLVKKKLAKFKPVIVDLVFEAIDTGGQVSRKLELTRQMFDASTECTGVDNFIEENVLETSNLLKDGNLTIKCSISIVTEKAKPINVQNEAVVSSTENSVKKKKRNRKRKAGCSSTETGSVPSPVVDKRTLAETASSVLIPPCPAKVLPGNEQVTNSCQRPASKPIAKKSWDLFANAIKRMD